MLHLLNFSLSSSKLSCTPPPLSHILGRAETKLSNQAYSGLHMSDECILMGNRCECKLAENWTIKHHLRRMIRQNAWGPIRQHLLPYVVGRKQNQDTECVLLQSPRIKPGLECCIPVSNPRAEGGNFEREKSLQPLKSLYPCLPWAPDSECVPSSRWKRRIKHSWALALKPWALTVQQSKVFPLDLPYFQAQPVISSQV